MSSLPSYLPFSVTVCYKPVCKILKSLHSGLVFQGGVSPRSAIKPGINYSRGKKKRIKFHVFSNDIKPFLLQLERKPSSGFMECVLIYLGPAPCIVLISDNKQASRYN